MERIPVDRIIAKVDACFEYNDTAEARRLLEYWRREAAAIGDKHGELSIMSELVGLYRKLLKEPEALEACERALSLIRELTLESSVSGATILLNCATAYKAFGRAPEAMPLYRRTEEIYRKSLPADDPRFGGLYNNMALALADMGQTEDAERAYLSALDIMKNAENGEIESAITLINMAHLYETSGETEKINGCMERAHSLLMTESLPRNGYYAFVCDKCVPSFEHFGYADMAKELMR